MVNVQKQGLFYFKAYLRNLYRIMLVKILNNNINVKLIRSQKIGVANIRTYSRAGTNPRACSLLYSFRRSMSFAIGAKRRN